MSAKTRVLHPRRQPGSFGTCAASYWKDELDHNFLLGNALGHRVEVLVQIFHTLVLLRVIASLVIARDSDLGSK